MTATHSKAERDGKTLVPFYDFWKEKVEMVVFVSQLSSDNCLDKNLRKLLFVFSSIFHLKICRVA